MSCQLTGEILPSFKAALTIVTTEFRRPSPDQHACFLTSFSMTAPPMWSRSSALRVNGTPASIKELTPIIAGELSGFSDEAVRAGYIGVAEWLVKGQAVREAVRHLLEDAA